jgi:hypothetical protein
VSGIVNDKRQSLLAVGEATDTDSNFCYPVKFTPVRMDNGLFQLNSVSGPYNHDIFVGIGTFLLSWRCHIVDAG